jgi:hypothetical protein
MAESFLEEQLKRIKEMTEQMSRARPFRDIVEIRNQTSDDRSSAPDRATAVRRPVSKSLSRRKR